MNIFDSRSARPMLLRESREAFDSPDYIFELKLDGSRCLAYLDEKGVTLQNKRELDVTQKFPELWGINKQVGQRCILDGELMVMSGGTPDFSAFQSRALMSDPFKIRVAMKSKPVSFTVFDVLFAGDGELLDIPLMDRKARLTEIVAENEHMAVARYIEQKGVEFFNLAAAEHLEGIVAKRRDSRYHMGKRTRDWIKIKNLSDDDFTVCGYIEKKDGFISVVLGKREKNGYAYCGHVTMGVSPADIEAMRGYIAHDCPFGEVPPANGRAVWLKPELTCTVQYMHRTQSGALRAPVFKGLRTD